MSHTLFVNISDIHIKESNKNQIYKKFDALIKQIHAINKLNNYKKTIILVSGDIAFSGKKEEYSLLDSYFEDLAITYDLIMCPGNHDHDFSSYASMVARNQLLKLSPDQQDSETIRLATTGMENYYDFESKYTAIKKTSSSPLSNTYELIDEQGKIFVSSLNTAWCSQLKEVGGDIRFPIKFLPQNSGNDRNIVFFHHPLSWIEPNNQKEVRNIIREEYSIILTGHEHLGDSFKVIGESNSCLMIEAIPLDDPQIKDNGFITFIIKDNDVIIKNYLWTGSEFTESVTLNKSDVMKNCSISTNHYHVNYDFYKSLLDIGVTYLHPDKDQIDLNDVFVYPNLKLINDDNKFNLRKVASDTLLNLEEKKTLLIGDEYCGKTTLLRKLFIDAVSKGFIPLLIEGPSIRSGGVEYEKILARQISKQYSNLSLIDFVNTSNSKVLLLDGFELIKGDRKSISTFLERSYNIFDKIIITVSDTFDFGGSELLGESYFDDGFNKYEILKLGYRLRYELVNKWNSLKEECSNGNGCLLYKNNHAVKTITKVLGKNYIPSTPFFLLTLLQSMESGNALEVSANTYGYYYEYLITQSLGNASVKKEELDEFFNYVKELSYYFFTKNIKDESDDNLWRFNNDFCSEYGVRIDFENRFKQLVKAKILEKKDGNYYKFKYPYVYYFFIAKYLSDTIRTDNTTDIIDSLISTLSRRRSMSILMFLTHHSRDESILDKVVTQTHSLFKELDPAKLEMDTNFINSIIDKMPEFPINFQNQNRLDYRRNLESHKDDVEEGNRQDFDSLLNDDDDESSLVKAKEEDVANNFIRDMNLTFKSLEILGQLSRNYYGSLKVNQKQKLLEEAISAPLRSLEFFFSLIDDSSDRALEMIEKKLNEKFQGKSDSITSNQIKEVAKRLLFEMILSLSLFFITKISSSIGSVNLQQVIDNVCDDMDSNAGKLIKLSTMLELGNSVSVDQIKRFVMSIDKNHLSNRLMKAIIINYLYMFERSEQDSQQICSIAGINYGQLSKQIGYNRLS